MTTRGELPHSGVEELLDEAAIERFRDTVVWPAVGHFWGSDFRALAADGEEMGFQKKLITPEGPARVELAAVCWHDRELQPDSNEDSKVLQATITVEKMRTELTEGMLEAMLCEVSDETREEVYKSSGQGLLQAWSVNHYEFSSQTGKTFDAEETYEIQDQDGDELWGTDGFDTSEDSKELSEEEEDALKDLELNLGAVMTRGQTEDMVKALLSLGVPAEKIGAEFWPAPSF